MTVITTKQRITTILQQLTSMLPDKPYLTSIETRESFEGKIPPAICSTKLDLARLKSSTYRMQGHENGAAPPEI
jgi:Tfp pilus assembly protein PilN